MANDINVENYIPVNPLNTTISNTSKSDYKVKLLPQTGNVLPANVKKENLSPHDVSNTVKELNAHAQLIKRELQFSIDTESGQTVIKVMDSQTKEMIRQIPNEEALKAVRKLNNGINLELFSTYS